MSTAPAYRFFYSISGAPNVHLHQLAALCDSAAAAAFVAGWNKRDQNRRTWGCEPVEAGALDWPTESEGTCGLSDETDDHTFGALGAAQARRIAAGLIAIASAKVAFKGATVQLINIEAKGKFDCAAFIHPSAPFCFHEQCLLPETKAEKKANAGKPPAWTVTHTLTGGALIAGVSKSAARKLAIVFGHYWSHWTFTDPNGAEAKAATAAGSDLYHAAYKLARRDWKA